MIEKYATEIATRLALDGVIVKLVQNTAKSHSHKFTKYQKVRAIDHMDSTNTIDGVVVDIKRGELNYDTLDYSKLYYVYHILPDGNTMVKFYSEHMLESIDE